MLVSSLNAFSVDVRDLESYSEQQDPCRLICYIGTSSQCESCFQSVEPKDRQQKRMLGFHSRQNRNDGCGCCALSRRSNRFCCATCDRANLRRG
ncbi:hypothetical protein RRG08_032582 [Elysia crispata]|uniref:Uncharacterized protein n=1 Tax=Elysia crispata TaxID=231223 RepID=A0AAE1DNW3_9GAST|nr:hypothetical protein RRG08_032582 [Elysia crispata]